MPSRPFARCYVSYRCTCRTPSVRKSAPIKFSLKRLLPVAPKPPACPWCGATMVRSGSTYQALLSSDWDSLDNRSRVRLMFAAMLGRA